MSSSCEESSTSSFATSFATVYFATAKAACSGLANVPSLICLLLAYTDATQLPIDFPRVTPA